MGRHRRREQIFLAPFICNISSVPRVCHTLSNRSNQFNQRVRRTIAISLFSLILGINKDGRQGESEVTFHEFAFTDPRHTWRPASISSPCFRLSHSRYPAHVRPLSIILSFYRIQCEESCLLFKGLEVLTLDPQHQNAAGLLRFRQSSKRSSSFGSSE